MFLLLSVNQLDECLHVFVLCTNVISKVDVVLLLRPIGGDCLARGGDSGELERARFGWWLVKQLEKYTVWSRPTVIRINLFCQNKCKKVANHSSPP